MLDRTTKVFRDYLCVFFPGLSYKKSCHPTLCEFQEEAALEDLGRLDWSVLAWGCIYFEVSRAAAATSAICNPFPFWQIQNSTMGACIFISNDNLCHANLSTNSYDFFLWNYSKFWGPLLKSFISSVCNYNHGFWTWHWENNWCTIVRAIRDAAHTKEDQAIASVFKDGPSWVSTCWEEEYALLCHCASSSILFQEIFLWWIVN